MYIPTYLSVNKSRKIENATSKPISSNCDLSYGSIVCIVQGLLMRLNDNSLQARLD